MGFKFGLRAGYDSVQMLWYVRNSVVTGIMGMGVGTRDSDNRQTMTHFEALTLFR